MDTSTWQSFGVDGNRDGRHSPYDPADAIPAAPRYLRASGAPDDLRAALFANNHADWDVAQVLAKAAEYRPAPTTVARRAPSTSAPRQCARYSPTAVWSSAPRSARTCAAAVSTRC